VGGVSASASGYRSVEEDALEVFRSVGRHLRSNQRVNWIRQPVPVAEWLNDPYYIGHWAHDLYPAVKRYLVEACSPKYSEVIIGGALAIGKTLGGVIIGKRLLYELSCADDPAASVGLAAGSPLYFAFVNVNKERAKEAAFEMFKAAVDDSPYFQDHFKRDKDFDAAQLRFPKGIVAKPVITSEQGIISSNLVYLLIDELAFMKVTQKSRLARGADTTRDQSKQIYLNAVRRMKGRFYSAGHSCSKRVLCSSANAPGDFVEQRKAQAEAAHDPDVFITAMSVWEAKAGVLNQLGQPFYSSETFPVEVGDEVRLSRMLGPHDKPAEGARVVNFPIDFLADCKADLEGALRDYAGIALVNSAPLITDRKRVRECVREVKDGYADHECLHPFTVETTTLEDAGALIEEYLVKRDKDGRPQPRIRPEAPRIIGLDASYTTDPFGFAMLHFAGTRLVHDRDRTGDETYDTAPIIYVDFMLQIKRPQGGGDISHKKVEELIEKLSGLGFQIALIAYDLPGEGLANRLADLDYDTEKVSVDKTPAAYVALKDAINEHRFSIYEYRPFIKELVELEYDRIHKKIDHPRGANGTKDVADAVCLAAKAALDNRLELCADAGGMATMTCETW